MADARAIRAEVRDVWLERRLTGRELHDHAVRTADAPGWERNPDLSGHRLSGVPHAAAHDGPMADADLVPAAGLWVLEIAIVHPDRPSGAFSEDQSLEDRSFPG